MRKILLLIIILMLILCSCSGNIKNITKIDYASPVDSSMPKISEDKDFINLLVDSINNSSKLEGYDDNKVGYDYLINLYKGNKSTLNYILRFINEEKLVLFKDSSGEWFKVKDEYAENLFLNERFSDIYPNSKPPGMFMFLNDNILETNISYDWSYKRINNLFYNKNYIFNTKNNKINFTSKDKLTIKFTQQPDDLKINVYHNNEILKTIKSFDELNQCLSKDGDYKFEVEAIWNQNDNKDYYGSCILSNSFTVDMDASVKILSKNNYPGDILITLVQNLNKDETVKLSTDVVNVKVQTYPYEDTDSQISFMPINIWTATGTYKLTAVYNEGTEKERIDTMTFAVSNKDFPVQYLKISDEVSNSTRNDKSYEEFAEFVKSERSKSCNEKLWEGKFIMPLEGRMTTDFGEIRYVNDEIDSSRHSGLDIAAPCGTDVASSNSGKVVLAKELILTGNTIIVDHGLGIFTTYYHLNSMNVTKGDMVAKGQIIGTVGSTGFSTGPHLHFSVSVYNSYVNTHQILDGEFFN